jgi:hypothetical protein
MILLTNTRTLFSAFDVSDSARIPAYIAILLVTAASLYVAALRGKRRAAVPSTEVAIESANA